MQKVIRSLSSMLAIMSLVCVSLVSLTACSDDKEPVEIVTYSWEFEEVLPSTPDFMDDKNSSWARFFNYGFAGSWEKDPAGGYVRAVLAF